MRPPRCHCSRLSKATSRSIHFSKRLRGFEYLYCRGRTKIILEAVEILPTEDAYRFPRWAPDSRERRTDCEGDWLTDKAGRRRPSMKSR